MTRNTKLRSMLGLVGLAILMLLTGCLDAQALSQGNVPCRQGEMEIVDEENLGVFGEGSPTSWTVICRGKTYYCGARYSQYDATEVDCVRADE